MIVTIVLFVIGALFGLHMLTHVLQRKSTPKISIILHGLLVAIALIIVIIEAVNLGNGMLVSSMVLFIAAALGGFYMVYLDVGKKQLPPKMLALIHPLLAVIGLVVLIIFVAGR
ncbi:MAG: hypothetical protein ACM3S2_00605 [Ignavibacteriales bacterium]